MTPKTKKQEYLRKGVAKALQEKRASALGHAMADMVFICKEAGIDPVKMKAARGEAAKNLLKTTALISAFPILQGLGTGLVRHFASKKDQKSMEAAHSAAFSEAMKLSDPDKEPLHANKEKAKQVFKSLVHFAPHVAMEPQAARAFMNRFVNLDLGIASSDIRELSEIEKNMRQGGNASPFLEGLFKSLDSSGLSQTIQKSVGESTDPMKHQTRVYVGEAHGLEMKEPAWREIGNG